jgi:hypothetical protein
MQQDLWNANNTAADFDHFGRSDSIIIMVRLKIKRKPTVSYQGHETGGSSSTPSDMACVDLGFVVGSGGGSALSKK